MDRFVDFSINNLEQPEMPKTTARVGSSLGFRTEPWLKDEHWTHYYKV